MTVRDGEDPALPEDDTRDDDLWDSAQRKLQAGEPMTKQEANAYFAASLFNPTNQVYFRAGLIACREYMARFVAAQSPEIAASIRANWWPKLGKDYGPPRQMDWNELVSSGDEFPVKTRDDISPTLEALPIALQFLDAPAYGKPYGTENHMQLPAGYQVWATDVQPSDELGAWTCKACGFSGFWRGGPHCGPSGVLGTVETNTPESRDSQHVLKAEAARPDATDRENPGMASPDGGPMGVGQPAAAGPIGVAPSQAQSKCPDCGVLMEDVFFHFKDCPRAARLWVQASSPSGAKGPEHG